MKVVFLKKGKKIQRKRHLRRFLLAKCSLPSTVSKTTTKRIGHRARKRDMMGQSYPGPFMPELVLITRVVHRSTLHFVVAGNIVY